MCVHQRSVNSSSFYAIFVSRFQKIKFVNIFRKSYSQEELGDEKDKFFWKIFFHKKILRISLDIEEFGDEKGSTNFLVNAILRLTLVARKFFRYLRQAMTVEKEFDRHFFSIWRTKTSV